MAERLHGRKAIVTGGARGIGGAIAIAFAREGADVALFDLRLEAAEEMAATLKPFGGKTFAVAADVSDEDQVNAAVAAATDTLGPIDTDLFRKLPEEWRKHKIGELPIGRAGQVEEIAPTAVLLASEEGAYYVGATMNSNGGDVMI